MACRDLMAGILKEAGYDVRMTDSAAVALRDTLKRSAEVVLLGSELDEVTAAELIPLLKRCNRELSIILVADEVPLPLIRRVRREGIFYHVLKPLQAEDREELCTAVKCAFARLAARASRAA